MKSVNLSFLEPSGPLQVCNGTALPLLFVALDVQCACAILSSVACPALQYFSTLSHTIFESKPLKKKCVLWHYLQLLSETCIILRRTRQDMIKNVYWSSWLIWESNPIQKLQHNSWKSLTQQFPPYTLIRIRGSTLSPLLEAEIKKTVTLAFLHASVNWVFLL
jgi:hypothetical protein